MNFYKMLNESMEKMLTEAKQDEINFANTFGRDLTDRFIELKNKNRLSGSKSDFYFWIRMAKDSPEVAKISLEDFITELENKTSKHAENKRIKEEGVEVLYEDDEWLVLLIKTYEAAAKYGSGTTWCITGRYPGHEGRGAEYFDSYREDNGWDYYFYIKKNGRDEEGYQEKWCLCWDGSSDSWQVFNADDEEITDMGEYVEGAPAVKGLPDIANTLPSNREDSDEYEEHEPPAPRGPEHAKYVQVENPHDYEFRGCRSVEEAAKRMFADAEVVEPIEGPAPFYVIKHVVEEEPSEAERAEHPEEELGNIQRERFIVFVYEGTQGAGPLLMPRGRDSIGYIDFISAEEAKGSVRMGPGRAPENGEGGPEDLGFKSSDTDGEFNAEPEQHEQGDFPLRRESFDEGYYYFRPEDINIID